MSQLSSARIENELNELLPWSSSNEVDQFSSLTEETESTCSEDNQTKWKTLKSNAFEKGTLQSVNFTSTDANDGLSNIDKATGMESFVEKQKSSYMKRLQWEIKWLEKLEKLLLEKQVKNDFRKRKAKTTLKCEPHRCEAENQNQASEIFYHDAEASDDCICSCHNIVLTEKQPISDRYFVSIPNHPKTEKSRSAMVKPFLGKEIRKINTQDQPKSMFSNSFKTAPTTTTALPKPKASGTSWFISLEERKPWHQARDPGDGSHSSISPNALPDGNEMVLSVQLTLQDAISYFKGNFILRSKARQQKIGIAARNRKHRAQLNYIYLTGQREHQFTHPEPEAEGLHKPQKRFFSHREMRENTEKLYRTLPEVREEKDRRRKEEQAKTHQLMAKIYKRKIQEKALQGQVSFTLTERVQQTLWDL